MRESWDTMNIKTEMTVENFNYSNVEECISDFSHVDKVRFAVYCAELVIDIYEKYNLSKGPRLAIEAAKKWIESKTEENKKACKSFVIFAKDDARAAASASARAALAAADAARALVLLLLLLVLLIMLLGLLMLLMLLLGLLESQ